LLRTIFETYLTSHNYITCRGCHTLDSFGCPRSQMKLMVHKDAINAGGVDCLECHLNVGHLFRRGCEAESDWKSVGLQNRALNGRLPRARKGAYKTCDALMLAVAGVWIPIPGGSARERSGICLRL
jgi:hypothetical protein